MVTTQKVVLSAAITVLVGLTLGFDRPDWGVVSAFLMLQWGPDHVPGTVRGIHRMLGSVVGVLLFSILHYFGINGWTLLLALAACQFCAEIFVAKNYAICVIFSTPLALLMGNSATRPLLPTIQARCGEILLSILIATAVLWLWQRSAPVRNQARLQVRAMESMATLLGLLFVSTSCFPSAAPSNPSPPITQMPCANSGPATSRCSTLATSFWTFAPPTQTAPPPAKSSMPSCGKSVPPAPPRIGGIPQLLRSAARRRGPRPGAIA